MTTEADQQEAAMAPNPFRRSPWLRLLPPIVLLTVILHYNMPRGSIPALWRSSPRKAPSRGSSLGNPALVRQPFSRDMQLTEARETLEFWWHLKQQEEPEPFGPCPYSTGAPPTPPDSKEERALFLDLVKQGIDIMEAMGFSNLTTCGGRYPRLTREKSATGSLSDKMQHLMAGAAINADDAEDLLVKKFCYTPTFRPPLPVNVRQFSSEKDPEQAQLTLDPTFCQRLRRLHRDIVSGVEPPLLTIFVWIPDVLEDAAKVSRRFLALNLDLFQPFVRPVFVTDRRMVMAVANTIEWPCLPVEDLSPDNVPVFRSIAQTVMEQFNSTFYGYARATSVFDASLLETLLAVKETFLSTKQDRRGKKENTQERPGVFLYGSAMYARGVIFRNDYSAVGLMAKSKGRSDWAEKAESLTYFMHSKTDFSDLPSLQIDDKYLAPFLARLHLLQGATVIDASNTLLSVYNIHDRITNEWDRITLPSVAHNDSYNRVLAQNYLKYLRSHISQEIGDALATRFGKKFDIVFDKLK